MPYTVYFPDTQPLPLPPEHRFPARKYQLLMAAVLRDGIIDPDRLRPSPHATATMLEIAHDRGYIDAVFQGRLSAAMQADIGLPWSQVLLQRSQATVGGTLAAARDALACGFSGQLAGGTHHAHRSRGAGFCVFNDCAVAALTLLAERVVTRAAILDLDVHHGDGNATIFAGDPRIFIASVHGAKNYPAVKPASDLDIALPDHTGDASYLSACDRAIDAVLATRPQIVFYIAGVDPLFSDRLGRLSVSFQGLAIRDMQVFTLCARHGVPLVLLIGGGYAEPITDTVEAYANTWRAARDVYARFNA